MIMRLCKAGDSSPKSIEVWRTVTASILFIGIVVLAGCQDLIPRDTSSLFIPTLHRSEVVGFVAGFGTTFAAVPDLIVMLKRRSSAGAKPRMAAITGVFQLAWIYYGLLIVSRPVVAWNLVGVLINFLNVWAYRCLARRSN
jgi:MtN3 and saliva related transmembrane protein